MPFSLDAQVGIARWHWLAAGDPDPYFVTLGFTADTLAHFQAFVAAMASGWNSRIKSSTSSDQTLVETSGVWSPDGIALLTTVTSSGIAGTGGTGVLPSNCACLIKKETGTSGRANNGRMFWPNGILGEANVDPNGVITAGTVTALQTAFTNLFNDLNAAAGTDMVIVHSDPNGTQPPGTAGPLVTGFTVRPLIATQRRRMR